MAATNSIARQVRKMDPPLPLRGALVTNRLLVMGVAVAIVMAVLLLLLPLLLVVLLLVGCDELQGTNARRKWLPPTVATTRCQLRARCVAEPPLGEG